MRSKPKVFTQRTNPKDKALDTAQDLIRLHSDMDRTLRALNSAARPSEVEVPIDVVKLIARLTEAKRRLERRISRLVPADAIPVRIRSNR